MNMMREAGFQITGMVRVAVDPQLPFMGYTVSQGEGFTIVVSGMAVESGMLEGLLVHELSHIYRMQANHPSHNGHIIEEVVNRLGNGNLSRDYERRIIRDLVNDIQDLYADDIAVKVITQDGGLLSKEQMASFFQGWVKDEPVQSDDARRDSWVNASILAKNARVISQLRRHGIEDTGGKANDSNNKFLSRIPPTASRQFTHFEKMLTSLKEDVTEEEYRVFLARYLNAFVEIAERDHS